MKHLCIFCGSSTGSNESYKKQTRKLAKLILDKNYSLIYGGANVGLMKILADTGLEGGGEVIGVMPARLVAKEVAHLNLTRMHIVESMSERKNLMVKLSDGFIALPGGFGTLDELAEMITYNQLRLIDKPVAIYNIDGYFDALLKFFNHSVEEGFLRKEHRDNLIIEKNLDKLIRRMEAFKPVETAKWIRDIKKES